MKYKFLNAALEEYWEAVDYHSSLKLEDDFLFEVNDAISRILESPQLYADLRKGFRKCPVHRFRYTIVYRIQDGAVVIYAVAHLHRRPNYWSRRGE